MTSVVMLAGIGSTLGLGIYVIAGQVAIEKSGPSVIISFLIAAVVSLFAGLCYAEFGARVPRAGSAYVYSYVTVGELMAFVIGWNLVMEYVIGTASVARGYSTYIDSLFNHTMERFLNKTMPIHVSNMSSFPDFLSLAITLLLTVLMAFGVKNSTRLNNILTFLNLFVVLYIIICGAFKVDFHNWSLETSEVGTGAWGLGRSKQRLELLYSAMFNAFVNLSSKSLLLFQVPAGQLGGFFPFGITGMMEGAATCFYCFVGFDCIATTGEEVRNPQRAIPISITISLAVVCLAYLGVSGIETLMAPYWMPDYSAPLPWVFFHVGYRVGAYIIIIGAMFGLSTSLLGGMFPLPRILYAMASDRLIYAPIANVSPRFHTPLLATAIAGIFTGVMAMLFNTKELANMMSIGTLLAYTLVALSILILR
ncbi:SLC7A1 [Cordylochernes scorpioides]|uniref:SLC7A1 n=1 Tax=Cordylochernes scorpioides TaxID=51811 RepID=A0ABY6LLR2_9ARAC|nr:SLC7A1 [Cordylochernes scorpioides]